MDNNTKNNKSIGCFGVTLIAIVFVAMGSFLNNLVFGDKQYTDTQSATTQETTTQEPTTEEIKTFREELTTRTNETVANELIGIIVNDIGYTEDEIELNEIYNDTNYNIGLGDYNYKVTAMEGSYRIWNDTKTLYENGAVVMNKQKIDDTSINDADAIRYSGFVEDVMKQCLKNPSGAKVNISALKRNRDLIAAQGTVTAKNDFNAKVTSDFFVEIMVFDKDNFSYAPSYIEFEGQVTGEYIDIETY